MAVNSIADFSQGTFSLPRQYDLLTCLSLWRGTEMQIPKAIQPSPDLEMTQRWEKDLLRMES